VSSYWDGDFSDIERYITLSTGLIY
jgi:hypothetical protein